MKIPNKPDLQQIAFNHSLGIDFRDFLSFYIGHTAKPYSFSAINATLVPDNLNNLLERRQKLIMTIENKIRDEKLQ